jgi:hypothetical protein
MARKFDDGDSEYLKIDSAPITAPPFTIACWFYADDTSIPMCMFDITNSGDGFQRFTLRARGAIAGDPITFYCNTHAQTTTGYTINTWHHACAVAYDTDDRACLIDGGSKGTDNNEQAPVGLDRMDIGRLGDSTPSEYFSGRIAEVGLWDAALSDDEVAILAQGFSPPFVRPQNLVAYWPLIRDTDDDIIGGYSMTAFNGPTVGAHPPMIYPVRALVPALVVGVPVMMYDYRRRRV